MSNETTKIDDGGPAFAQHGWSSDPEILARMSECRAEIFASALASEAYIIADAMLKARKA